MRGKGYEDVSPPSASKDEARTGSRGRRRVGRLTGWSVTNVDTVAAGARVSSQGTAVVLGEELPGGFFAGFTTDAGEKAELFAILAVVIHMGV